LIHSANLAAEVDAEDEISAGDAGDDGAWHQPVGPSCLCASVSSGLTKIIGGSGSTAQHRLWFLRSFCLAGVRCRCNVCCVELCCVVLCCDMVQFWQPPSPVNPPRSKGTVSLANYFPFISFHFLRSLSPFSQDTQPLFPPLHPCLFPRVTEQEVLLGGDTHHPHCFLLHPHAL
jgi:hypothetical protein